MVATVIMGELAGERSPGHAYSPIVGVDVSLAAGAVGVLPLEPDFEYAVLSLSGTVEVDGGELAPGPLLYLGSGRTELAIAATEPGRGTTFTVTLPVGVPPPSSPQGPSFSGRP